MRNLALWFATSTSSTPITSSIAKNEIQDLEIVIEITTIVENPYILLRNAWNLPRKGMNPLGEKEETRMIERNEGIGETRIQRRKETTEGGP